MSRYVKTTLETIGVGDTVRLTEHFPKGSTVTYEGVVKEIRRQFWTDPATGEEYAGRTATLRGVPYEHPSFERIRAVEYVTVEKRLPDLPTTPGSVILVNGHAAVLRRVVDAPDGEWFYADSEVSTVGPSNLINAVVLHDAAKIPAKTITAQELR